MDNDEQAGAIADDLELVERARHGDHDAFAELFQRHRVIATRLARQMLPASEVDDVVAEAFVRVLQQITDGRGPNQAFRAYLLTAVRHEASSCLRACRRLNPTDDENALDSPVAFGAGHLDMFEGEAVRDAYASLPQRWQLVLWHLDVDGRKPREVADLLHMSPNSVSALAYRARSALREAYLEQHVNQLDIADNRGCRTARPRLAGLIRGTLTKRQKASTSSHLEECLECAYIYRELADVNTQVGALLTPGMAAVGSGIVAPQLGGIAALVAKLSGTIPGIAVAQPATYAIAAGAVVAAAVVPNHALLDIAPSDRDGTSAAHKDARYGQAPAIGRSTGDEGATDSAATPTTSLLTAGPSAPTAYVAPVSKKTSTSPAPKTDNVNGAQGPKGINIIQQKTTVEEGPPASPEDPAAQPSGEPGTESVRILRTETTTTVYDGIDRSSAPNLKDCAAAQYYGRDGNVTIISRTVFREITRILADGSKMVYTDSVREPDEYYARGLRKNAPQECTDTEGTNAGDTPPPIVSVPRGSDTPAEPEAPSGGYGSGYGGYGSGFGYVEPTTASDAGPTVEPEAAPAVEPAAEPEAAPAGETEADPAAA